MSRLAASQHTEQFYDEINFFVLLLRIQQGAALRAAKAYRNGTHMRVHSKTSLTLEERSLN